MQFVCKAVRDLHPNGTVGWSPTVPGFANAIAPNPDDNGAMWFAVTDQQEPTAILPRVSFDAPIDRSYSAAVNGDLSSAEFNYLLSLQTSYIGDVRVPAGEYFVSDGASAYVVGNISPISSGVVVVKLRRNSAVIGIASSSSFTNGRAEFTPDSNGAMVQGITFSGTQSFTAITFDCSAESRPYNCKAIGNTAIGLTTLYHFRAGELCELRGNTAIDCTRGFVAYSARSCSFSGERSLSSGGTPIVGFLNISTISKSFGRGFYGNTYENINIDNFLEEGFSYDLRGNEEPERSFRWSTHVTASHASGISVVTTKSLVGSEYMCVFHTGALAGNAFEIASIQGDTVNLNQFGEHASSVAIGDFITVELLCMANKVNNLTVKGSTDRTGVMLYMFGYGTTFNNPTLDNCRIEITSTSFNRNVAWASNCFASPHHVKIIDPIFLNQNLSDYSVYVNKENDFYTASQSDDSMPDEQNLLRGLAVIRSNGGRNQFEAVAKMDISDVTPLDVFVGCSGTIVPTFAHPTQTHQGQQVTT